MKIKIYSWLPNICLYSSTMCCFLDIDSLVYWDSLKFLNLSNIEQGLWCAFVIFESQFTSYLLIFIKDLLNNHSFKRVRYLLKSNPGIESRILSSSAEVTIWSVISYIFIKEITPITEFFFNFSSSISQFEFIKSLLSLERIWSIALVFISLWSKSNEQLIYISKNILLVLYLVCIDLLPFEVFIWLYVVH